MHPPRATIRPVHAARHADADGALAHHPIELSSTKLQTRSYDLGRGADFRSIKDVSHSASWTQIQPMNFSKMAKERLMQALAPQLKCADCYNCPFQAEQHLPTHEELRARSRFQFKKEYINQQPTTAIRLLLQSQQIQPSSRSSRLPFQPPASSNAG